MVLFMIYFFSNTYINKYKINFQNDLEYLILREPFSSVKSLLLIFLVCCVVFFCVVCHCFVSCVPCGVCHCFVSCVPCVVYHRFVSCVPCVVSVSGLSILDCPPVLSVYLDCPFLIVPLCCQCLWIVNSWLSHRFSYVFVYYAHILYSMQEWWSPVSYVTSVTCVSGLSIFDCFLIRLFIIYVF